MDGFEKKQKIKKLGFNDQILVVNSTLFGETAADTNSFTLKLTQAFRLKTGSSKSTQCISSGTFKLAE